MLNFFDEDGNKITEKEGLRVWIKDRLVSLDDENYIILDYKEQRDSFDLIAAVGNYAKIFQTSFPK